MSADKKRLHPAAGGLVAIGGGVVGYDYATWLELDYRVGVVLGALVMLIATAILKSIAEEKEAITGFLSSVGGLAGAGLGGYVAYHEPGPWWGTLVGIAIGGAIGAGVGQVVAAFFCFAALAVLFISQGPVGFAVRTFVMELNE